MLTIAKPSSTGAVSANGGLTVMFQGDPAQIEEYAAKVLRAHAELVLKVLQSSTAARDADDLEFVKTHARSAAEKIEWLLSVAEMTPELRADLSLDLEKLRTGLVELERTSLKTEMSFQIRFPLAN